MATDNSTETMQDLAIQLTAAYQTMLDVDTMLNTLKDANSDENAGHMCEIIVRQQGAATETVELVARQLDVMSRSLVD